MPGSKPCQPGCGCGKHRGGKSLSPEENSQREHERYIAERDADPEARRKKTRESMARWRKSDRDRHRATVRTWRDANRDRVNEQKRLARNPEREREQRRARQHGLRAEGFARMWEAQEGGCCYCGDELPREAKHVHIDHDHTCCPPGASCRNCQRGLACNYCNTVVGFGLDDPDRLERIAASLRQLKAEARERINGKHVQGELPLNVVRIERTAEGA
jgi:Recombination endonuclease VII